MKRVKPGFLNIDLDKMGKAVDSNININDTSNRNMLQNDSNYSNKGYNKDGFMRITVTISEENLKFMKDYQARYSVSYGTKCSELLNRAIEDLKKESK